MEVPELVLKTYLMLRKSYSFYVALEYINGKYYVYRHKSIYDKATRKQRTESEYLGKITAEGAFIPKSASKQEKRLEEARVLLESQGARVIWPESRESEEVQKTYL